MVQYGETRIYILEAELKMNASQNVKEYESSVLTRLRVS